VTQHVTTAKRDQRQQPTCLVPWMHNFGNRSFSATGPRKWNSLLPYLRRDMNFEHFKSQLKKFLFGSCGQPRCIVTVYLFLHLRNTFTYLLTSYVHTVTCFATLRHEMGKFYLHPSEVESINKKPS